MEAINQLSASLGVFVRFFEQVNCLFFQIRWLQENIMRSDNFTMGVVAVIVIVCLYVTYAAPYGLSSPVLNALPIVVIVGVIAILCYWRYRSGRSDNKQPQYQTLATANNEAQRNFVEPTSLFYPGTARMV